jgi:hypothetical protein
VLTPTLVVDEAVLPLSSTTLQVTAIGPGDAPTVESVADELEPLTAPAVAL